MSDADRASYDAAEAEFAKLARGVDPDDPWAHPEADRLDRISVGAWMRSAGATPNAVRARELAMLSLAAESVERTSLLADLRKEAAAGARGFYDYAVWESGMVAEGSATVALRMASELEDRIRYSTPATAIEIASGGCAVETASGERFDCDAVVCAVPVGPLRRISIEGVSRPRLGSLDRQRNALAAKACFSYPDSFWERHGLNATAYMETTMIGGTWPQREGIISALIPPERLAAFLTTSPRIVERELTGEMVAAFGDEARRSDRRPHPALGGRPVDRGLHHRLAPRRRDRRRSTARHPRAAVLRLRLGPVGLRLHGGRRSHRPRGRCRGARAGFD